MKKLLSICLAATILFSSCATIISGSTQKVMLTSEQKADVYIKDRLVGQTPLQINMKRKTKEIVFKKDGYYDLVHICDRKTNPAYWANIPFIAFGFTGAIFMTIDLATGACYRQDKDIFVKLEKKEVTK